MSKSFLEEPVQAVPEGGEPDLRWVIRVQPSGRFPGWGWLATLDEGSHATAGPLGIVAWLLHVLTVPSRLRRRVAYTVKKREDWDVLIWRGFGSRLHAEATLREHHATKELAAARAAEVRDALATTGELPVA